MAQIQSITIKNFKGADDVTIDFSNRVHSPVITLIGLNESGKTTILEGISHFVTGDSSVSSLFDGVHLKPEPAALIPIHKKAAFSGEISVSALISLDDADFNALEALALKQKLALVKSSFPGSITVSQSYSFEDSVPKKTQRLWSFRFEAISMAARSEKGKKPKKYERPDEGSTSDLWLQATSLIQARLPKIAYFPTFLVDMPARIYLKAHKGEKPVNRYYRYVFQDILDSIEEGLSVDRHICKRIDDFVEKDSSPNWVSIFFGGPSKGPIDSVFQKIANSVTREVLGSWRNIFQLPISAKNVFIEWHVDTEKENIPYASFFVSDGESRYAISERSLGFRRFFSFLLFTSFKRKQSRQTLFLFDEPAANLHAKAQAELLKSFSRIVSEGNQIVYSTHSHHMINPKWLAGAYIVENTAIDYDADDVVGLGAKPTNIVAIGYRKFVSQHPSRTSYFQPVIEKLEYVVPALIGSPPFIVVEGISDYHLMKLVKDNGKFGSFSLIPGGGSGASGPLISLLLGRGERFVILLDDDKSGRDAAKRYRDQWHLSDQCVFTLEEIGSAFSRKSLEGLICGDTIAKMRTHMALSTAPTKKQVGLYFAEQCMTASNTNGLGKETIRLVSVILTKASTLLAAID